MPPMKVSMMSAETVISPEADSSSSVRLTPASISWMKMRNLRRSRMSESTPAGMASRKIGSMPAACTAATAAGEAERSVTSQALATSRMKVPVLPSTVAAQSTAKTGRRSGAKPSVGAGILFSVMAYTAQHAQPSAPQNERSSETGTLAPHAPAWAWPCTLQLLAQPHSVAN